MIVGTLSEGKGQEQSILALAHLRKRGVDAELTIIGDGVIDYRRHLQTLISSHNLERDVQLHGPIKNALPAMRCSDVILSLLEK